jgi:hypothetical protein
MREAEGSFMCLAHSVNLLIQSLQGRSYVIRSMKKVAREIAEHDLTARLQRYRRRVEAEGRSRSLRQIDRAIEDANDKAAGSG